MKWLLSPMWGIFLLNVLQCGEMANEQNPALQCWCHVDMHPVSIMLQRSCVIFFYNIARLLNSLWLSVMANLPVLRNLRIFIYIFRQRGFIILMDTKYDGSCWVYSFFLSTGLPLWISVLCCFSANTSTPEYLTVCTFSAYGRWLQLQG